MPRRVAVAAAVLFFAAGCRTLKRPAGAERAVFYELSSRAAAAPAEAGLGVARPVKPPKDPDEDGAPASLSGAARRAPDLSSTTIKTAAGEPQRKDPPALKPAAADSDTEMGEQPDQPPRARQVLGAARSVGEAPSPGLGAVGKGLPASKYLSPARLRRRPGPEGAGPGPNVRSRAALAHGGISPPEHEQDVVAPAKAAGPRTDVRDALFIDQLDIGSYRVQIATSSDFAKPLYDRIFEAVDNIDVRADFEHALSRSKTGFFWLRSAPIDLLGYQQPYHPSRRFRFVGRSDSGRP